MRELRAFLGRPFAAGSASERRTIAKQANGCRVALIFRIDPEPCVLRGLRRLDGADFKKTSKRLQSGAFFGGTAAFTPRSRRDRARCGGDGPKCPKINNSKTMCFWHFLEGRLASTPKTIKRLQSGAFFLKSAFSRDCPKMAIVRVKLS